MSGESSATTARLRAFCQRHPTWVAFHEPTAKLLEIGSGKRLGLSLKELVAAEERTNAESGMPYLMLRFGDGSEVALAEMGVAFPPVAPNVPQAPELPPVVCLKDFRAVLAHLQHQAVAHREEKLDRSSLDLVVLALGILEGARAVGFEVSEEERALDEVLGGLEKRR